MRRSVKRLLCAFLSAALLCQLCTGCSRNASGAEDVVTQFCAALQALDFDEITPLLSDDDAEFSRELSQVADSLSNLIEALSEKYPAIDFLRLCARNINFEITSRSSARRNLTEISVKFSYPDLYAMFKDYMQEHGFKALASFIDALTAFISGRPTEPKALQLAAPGLIDWCNTKLYGQDFPSVNIEITFQCKRQKRSWNIFDPPVKSLREMLAFNLPI